MNRIIKTNKKISLEEIDEFEKNYDIKLPEQYKKFMIKYNGGYPELSSFIISEQEGESLVNKFYGLEDDDCSLAEAFDYLEDVLPKDFISIADDPAGNEICLGIDGKYEGKIYFWFHDRNHESQINNMYFLADSFDEFFNMLYE